MIDAHYQDQSDKPEDLSDEEWKERCRIVSVIFGLERLDKAGFVYVPVDKQDCYNMTSEVLREREM